MAPISQHAPIDRLPQELWIDIIEEVTTMNEAELFYIDIDLLLPLTLVSQRWKQVIVRTPTFWTDILIGNVENLQLKTSLSVYLSQDVPLNLRFALAYVRLHWFWGVVSECITSQRGRIHTVAFLKGSIYEDIHQIGWVLDQLSTMPVLRRVYYSQVIGFYPDLNKFTQQHSSLVDVHGPVLRADALRHDSRQWVRLYTTEDPPVVTSHLRNAGLVENVTIMEDEDVADFRSQQLSTEQLVEWEAEKNPVKWKSLCFLDRHTQYLVKLLPRLTTFLIELDLEYCDMSVGASNEILSILGEFKRLRTLKIAWYGARDEVVHLPPAATTPLQSLKELTLHLCMENVEYRTALEAYFAVMAPCVHSLALRMSQYGLDDGLRFLNHGRLVVARFTAPMFVVTNNKWKIPVSLQKLEIDCHPANFPKIEMSSLLTLSIQWKTWSPKRFGESFDLQTCPALHSLQLNGCTLLWNNLLHHHLWKINIRNSDGMKDDDFVTEFCRQLSLHPGQLPALRHLEMNQYPEWDIFFICLERRISLGYTVSRIRHVVLPPNPPPLLREYTRRLLRGEVGHRPSNYDLSLIGNMDILCDASISGCLRCHKVLRHCPAPTYHSYVAQERTWFRYPDDVNEILLTWPERRDAWRQIKGMNRRDGCKISEQETPLTIITEDSLEYPTFDPSREAIVRLRIADPRY